MSDVECPTCGDDHFKNRRGMKIHHKWVHDESLSLNTYECDICGETFTRHQSKIVESGTTLCSSPSCHGEHTKRTQEGDDHWKWSGGKEEYRCEECGDVVERYAVKVENQDNIFCSYQCQSDYESRQNRKNVLCDWCEEPIELTQSRVEKGEHHFCSNECKGKWYTENLVGEDSPHWVGGHEKYYGPTWRRQRRRALERDEYECQDCGMTQAEHHEQWNHGLEVHHITPIRTFSDTNVANQLDNLITVCKHCHIERETN